MEMSEQIRQKLVYLRQQAGLTQTQLAERMSVKSNASRISRIESGESTLTLSEVCDILNAINTEESLDFARYLNCEWRFTRRPGFEHANRHLLWDGECALARLDELEKDPDLKGKLIKQINASGAAIHKTMEFLFDTEHYIVFVGSPGVGKTTLICGLADLYLPNPKSPHLGNRVVLQTGGGRITICEVHIKGGSEYAVSIVPSSNEDMVQYVADFCDAIMDDIKGGADNTAKNPGLSKELDRAIRNMADLTKQRTKTDEGQTVTLDPSHSLAEKCPDRDSFKAQVFSRLNLYKRRETMLQYPRNSELDGMDWLSKVTSEINYGKHPLFSLPSRMDVVVPHAIFGAEGIAFHLVDTRGVDEPSVPRKDLQQFFDDERAIIVLCSSFKDAPDAAMQSVLRWSIQGGSRDSILNRGLLVALPKNSEEKSVVDDGSDGAIGDIDEGRFLKKEEIEEALKRQGMQDIAVDVADVSDSSDCTHLRNLLAEHVYTIRAEAETRLKELVAEVDRLIKNKETEAVKATYDEIFRRLQVWIDKKWLPYGDTIDIERDLLARFNDIRPQSLRASINRRGNWPSFDYWHLLGFGARQTAAGLITPLVASFNEIVDNLLDDDTLKVGHTFLRTFRADFTSRVQGIYAEMQVIGERAFYDTLWSNERYWQGARERWGSGAGYRVKIQQQTNDWFWEKNQQEQNRLVALELSQLWNNLLFHLKEAIMPPEEQIMLDTNFLDSLSSKMKSLRDGSDPLRVKDGIATEARTFLKARLERHLQGMNPTFGEGSYGNLSQSDINGLVGVFADAKATQPLPRTLGRMRFKDALGSDGTRYHAILYSVLMPDQIESHRWGDVLRELEDIATSIGEIARTHASGRPKGIFIDTLEVSFSDGPVSISSPTEMTCCLRLFIKEKKGS